MMNLSLRTGESIEFSYRPQGRYNLTELPRDLGTIYKDYWQVGPVRLGSLAWTDEKPAAYGNAVVEYAPDLRSKAFLSENPRVSNVAVVNDRRRPQLAAAKPGEPASLLIEVNTPFVIVGKQNDLTDFEDDNDAARVKGLFWRADSDENRIFVSDDAGRTWKLVWENRFTGAVPFDVDLSRHVRNRYAYWVKFEWVDRGGKGLAGLENVSLKTWLEVSPMGLPRLVSGKNSFQVAASPRRTFYHESYWHRGGNLDGQQLRNLALSPKVPYLRPQTPAEPAELIFRAGPEGTIEEMRLSVEARALGSMSAVSVALAISEDGGAHWRELERFKPDPEHSHNNMWFNHVIRNASLPGARTLLKVSLSGAGLDKVIANSAVTAAPATQSTLRITHRWREGEQSRSAARAVSAASPRYEVETSGAIRNERLRLEAIAQ
jgi:hypothetical protein